MSFIGLKVQHYRVLKYLGNGGMGEVYAAHDERLDRKVALKAIRREHRLKPEVKARLLREARLLSGLEHSHICRIYDILDYERSDILVLELIEGESMKAIFGNRTAGENDQPLDQQPSDRLAVDRHNLDLLKIAEQIALALAAAHEQGVVHRDLKPDNVMLTSAGEVKVLDFGLARRLTRRREARRHQPVDGLKRAPFETLPNARSDETEHGRFLGTPAYMSPEQVAGKKITTASDMYSLGILLQEMFTGKPAYEARTMPTTLIKVARAETAPIDGIDSDLAALIERLESKAPANRPSALDVCERLKWIRSKPIRRRRRLLRAAAMVLWSLATLALTIQTYRIGRTAERANREATERANREALISRQVSDSMVDLFTRADPDGEPDASRDPASSITAREILAGGALDDQALVILEAALGPDHPYVGYALAGKGSNLLRSGQHAEAEAPLARSLAILEKSLGAEHVDVGRGLEKLARALAGSGESVRAEVLLERSRRILAKALGTDHPEVADLAAAA